MARRPVRRLRITGHSFDAMQLMIPPLCMNTKNTVRLRWIAAAVYTVPPKPNFYSLKAQFPHGCCDYAQHDKCKPRTLHTLPPRLPRLFLAKTSQFSARWLLFQHKGASVSLSTWLISQ